MRRLNFGSARARSRLLEMLDDERAGEALSRRVSEILEDVRKNGDRAIAALTEKFDRVSLSPKAFRVPDEDIEAALRSLGRKERASLREAIACVRDYNRRCLPRNWTARNPHGASVGESFYPISRVGIYVPGGKVPLLSTAIMTVTLAKIAKVPEIVVCTPPGPDGTVPAGTLAAARLSGAGEVFRIGGVQAIAAMAFGTGALRPVDKIFGPGNAYVVEAKRQVFGRVGIDLLPGPSEVMVIADGSARPDWVAADLLAQAEHGHGGKMFLVSAETALIDAVDTEVRRQIPSLGHQKVLEKAMAEDCVAVVVSDDEQAADVANLVAPEHLELHVSKERIRKYRRGITTAGAVLEGEWTPAVLGDFTAGPSHVLPTGRSGRFCSGLQVTDFMRRTSRVAYGPWSMKQALPIVKLFSALEGLDAHGRSASFRDDGSRSHKR